MEIFYLTKRLKLIKSSECNTSDILSFLHRNKDFFEQYEEIKPDMFYTIQFQNNIKNTEAVLSRDSSFLRYYIFNIDDTSTILGTISIKKCSPSTQTSVRIGYKIDEKECNQGFAYEALSFLIPRIFLSGITQQLEAIVCPTNIASIHLLSKLGFILDPTRSISCQLKQGTLTHHIYCLHSGISVTNMHQ